MLKLLILLQIQRLKDFHGNWNCKEIYPVIIHMKFWTFPLLIKSHMDKLQRSKKLLTKILEVLWFRWHNHQRFRLVSFTLWWSTGKSIGIFVVKSYSHPTCYYDYIMTLHTSFGCNNHNSMHQKTSFDVTRPLTKETLNITWMTGQCNTIQYK